METHCKINMPLAAPALRDPVSGNGVWIFDADLAFENVAVKLLLVGHEARLQINQEMPLIGGGIRVTVKSAALAGGQLHLDAIIF